MKALGITVTQPNLGSITVPSITVPCDSICDRQNQKSVDGDDKAEFRGNFGFLIIKIRLEMIILGKNHK